MDTVDHQTLLDVLEPALRELCGAEGRDFDRIRASGRWPAISELSRRSGVEERKLRRMLNAEQPVSLLDADALLCAVGLGLSVLGEAEHAGGRSPVFSELMLTVDVSWPFR